VDVELDKFRSSQGYPLTLEGTMQVIMANRVDFTVRLSQAEVDALDQIAKQMSIPGVIRMSRNTAIRVLLREGLVRRGFELPVEDDNDE